MALYEDAAPDLLAGRMDLQVILPEGDQQKVSVPRSTAMMDLRVQLTTSRKLSPSAFSLQPLGPAGETLPFQPSTPVGALDVWSVRLIPKTRSNSSVPVKRAAPRPIPVAPGAPVAPTLVVSAGAGTGTRTIIGGPGPPAFEQTFRLQVHLPRNQLFVTRASSRVLLGDVLQLACQEKNLDPAKYEIRHPANLEERLSLEATLGECNLTEVALVPCGTRQPDTPALLRQEARRQEARRREAAHRGTGASTLSAHFPYVVPHTVGAEGSVSSMSSGGRSASPAPSDGSSVDRSTSPPQTLPPQTLPPQSLPPQSLPPPATTKVPPAPNRPGRKRRPAPKPPGPPTTELNNNVCNKEANAAPVISHSRNSSDSSGYHEASVLSESPEGGASCVGSGTESLPSLAPRGKNELSQSMTNLSLAPHAALKTSGNALGLGKRKEHSASTSALFPQGKGQRKKKAPPPPPPVAVTSTPSVSTPSSVNESFLKTQSLERRDMVRTKSSTLPAMSSTMMSPADHVSSAEPSSPEMSLAPSTLAPSPCPPAANVAASQPLSQHARVGSSSGSQTPTPTPSEGDSCMAPEDPDSQDRPDPEDHVDCTGSLTPPIPPAVTPRRMVPELPDRTHPEPVSQLGAKESSWTKLDAEKPKPRPRRPVRQDREPDDEKAPESVTVTPSPAVEREKTENDTKVQSGTTDLMYLARSAPLFRRNWLSNSGSFGEEASSRHESMPYDASLTNEYYEVIHEEAEMTSGNTPSKVNPDEKDVLTVTPATPEDIPTTPKTPPNAKREVNSPRLTPKDRTASVSSNDTLYLTPNSTKTESTFGTPGDKSEEEWHYRLPSPPSAFRDARSDSPTNPRALESPALVAAADDEVSSEMTSRTGTSSHSDEEIERITGGGSVASDESPPRSPVERPIRASPRLPSGPISLSGKAAVLNELSQVISEQRNKDRVKRASTLEHPKTTVSRLDNFSMSTYSRPQSAHSVISPEVKPSLVVARRSSFNNGACTGNGVSVRRTTSHATFSGLSAGQSAIGKEAFRQEAFRTRTHDKPLARATSEMNLNSGLPAPLQLDPEQASLLDEFMEWRRQQRLKKQAQNNESEPGDIRATVLEDDVQSLQMFQRILNHVEATELMGSKCSPPPAPSKPPTPPPKPKEAQVEQETVKELPVVETSPAHEIPVRPKETTLPTREAPEEVVLRHKPEGSSQPPGRPRNVVSGPPNIQMSTWNERPKRQVSIKLDGDYRFGVGAAGLRRTGVLSGLVQGDKTQSASDDADSVRRITPSTVDVKPTLKPDLDPKIVSSQKADPSRVPIVRAVELKRTTSEQPVTSARPIANSVVYLSASDDSSVKAVSVAGSTSNKTKKFTSVVDISGPGVPPLSAPVPVPVPAPSVNGNNGIRVNGVVPHGNEAKKNLPMPVVKPFKLKGSVMSRQLSAPNPTPPPPPPAPPTMPVLKKPRPHSLPAKALDPRDQLLEAIRNFGGRTNLRPT